MTRDQLEFQISQYVDGTLSADDVAALDEIFARDPEARTILAEYRAVDAMLKREGAPLPDVKWDALAATLSAAVAKEELPQRRLRIWTATWTRVAVAAMVVFAIGLTMWIHMQPATNGTIANNDPVKPPVAVANVTGPAIESAPAAPVAIVSIGPSPLAQASHARLAETMVYRPPRVVIASGQANRQDTPRLPY
jgi:anti-sigma factor RsiW